MARVVMRILTVEESKRVVGDHRHGSGASCWTSKCSPLWEK